jgi:NADH-quinone oxidoreductase subunit M
MLLTLLIVVLVVGGLVAWYTERWGDNWPRWISLGAVLLTLVLGLLLWSQTSDAPSDTPWLAHETFQWIPRFGVSFLLALDGLSLLMILLTGFLGVVSVIASWREIRDRVGFFHFHLLWTLAGAIGVFLALDLFLFFFFWELMLVPMYFLIAIWGHENRRYAALKFFLFTQGSGLLMLVSILTLAFSNYQTTGVLTFNYFDLLENNLSPFAAMLTMLGFLVAFAVKLPAIPFHTWLPDAHTEAPTAGSIILAGVLLKTGAYGLLRFVLPLFPDAAFRFAPIAMALGAIGVIYGAILAFAQNDLKRLVAYSSVSHMGFVLLGVFAWNQWALHGAVLQMIAHGVSTSALFMIVGALQERIHTRDMEHMGGLAAVAPRMAAMGMFFAIASLGLPGLGNFVGEFLVLLGAYRVNVVVTVLSALGLITAAVYSLILVQQAFHGENKHRLAIADLSGREMTALFALVVAAVWLGLYPQPIIDRATAMVNHELAGGRSELARE